MKRKILIVTISLALLTFLSACNKENKGDNSQGTTQTGTQKVAGNTNSSTNKANTSSSAAATSSVVRPTTTPAGLQNETTEERIKRQTYNLHKGFLDILILKKNPAVPPVFFSNDYVNLFTGEKKQGLDSKFFEEFYINDNTYKVNDSSKLVDCNKSETLTYDEIMRSPDKYYVKNKANFQYKQGDVLVIIPPVEGSPLKDGWIGVYRMIGEQKKLMAGSF